MGTVISMKDSDKVLMEKIKSDVVFQLQFDMMDGEDVDKIVHQYHQYEADQQSNHRRDFNNTNYGYKLVNNGDTRRSILTMNNDVFIAGLQDYYHQYNIPRLDYNMPAPLRNDLYQLYHHVYAMMRRMMMLISKDVFNDVNYLQNYIAKENFVMVFNYYYAVDGAPKAELTCKRFDEHYDFSLISVIFNDDYLYKEFNFEYEKDGEWRSLDNQDHRFTVFFGMLMEIVTDGAYKALNHRTVMQGANRNRFMVGFFAQPDEDKQLQICDQHAHLLDGYQYDHFNREISYNTFMRETMCSQLLKLDLVDEAVA
ncbi:MAG: hypothetical protein OEW58_00880 [Gammaproteobacteria bacterium]|nr:hypothetical protein [Gammaproteobacteria bacterium]